jgi:predicted methyltransferase
MYKLILCASFIVMSCPLYAGDLTVVASVERAMNGAHRSDSQVARNQYRHPVGTLEFFGLEKDMSVLEIWPGSGWYTEILAPVLRENGHFAVASWDQSIEGQASYRYELPGEMLAKFEANPKIYDKVEVIPYSPPESASLGEANNFDMVLTFRNVHGWYNSGTAQAIFNEFARVLKLGGVLGVVQHRATHGTDPAETAPAGYVSEQTVIAFAKAAGLELDARSEANANPKDTRDYEEGVWTLPPGFTLGEMDREKYAAIGESDRMTLRFRKPK